LLFEERSPLTIAVILPLTLLAPLAEMVAGRAACILGARQRRKLAFGVGGKIAITLPVTLLIASAKMVAGRAACLQELQIVQTENSL
jgi:ABC-type uncharacterized transport system permease subunit